MEEDQKEGLYRRFTETHYQRGYRLDQIRRLLEESGLVFVEALDADTMQEVTEKSERVFCIASEHGNVGQEKQNEGLSGKEQQLRMPR